MSNNQKDEPTLSMKVLKGPLQIEREKNETIWDRFDRLQSSLAPLRKGKQISKGIHRIKREGESKSMAFKKKTITGNELAKLWEGKPRISNENAEDWLNIIKEVRSEQKLPDIKWD
ncbi:hypothetical protein OAV71_06440 [Opitutales bacterium]|nr:hypothetical protein [Opitutales bacterium]